jgi:hypothetical protein
VRVALWVARRLRAPLLRDHTCGRRLRRTLGGAGGPYCPTRFSKRRYGGTDEGVFVLTPGVIFVRSLHAESHCHTSRGSRPEKPRNQVGSRRTASAAADAWSIAMNTGSSSVGFTRSTELLRSGEAGVSGLLVRDRWRTLARRAAACVRPKRVDPPCVGSFSGGTLRERLWRDPICARSGFSDAARLAVTASSSGRRPAAPRGFWSGRSVDNFRTDEDARASAREGVHWTGRCD